MFSKCYSRVSQVAVIAMFALASNAWAASPQQHIRSFSPTSGPSGVIVTLKGSGFTGSNQAWVGSAHDATIQIVSDTEVHVTIPADATTGAIAVLNPNHAAFTPRSFTFVKAVAVPQPVISSISPASGPVGTVITLAGSGFTGSTHAWVGGGHDAALTIVSDTKALATVPADATTGSVTLVNASHSGSSAAAFTLTVPAASLVQQVISGFAPVSGPVGSVVTITGSGFTGSSAAWIGSAHDAAVNVVSDSRIDITVPADASTGQIAILSSQHAAFSPMSFTVAAASTGSTSGSTGTSSAGGTTTGGGTSSGSGDTTSGSGDTSSGSTSTGSTSGGSTSTGSGTATPAPAGTSSVQVRGNQLVDANGSVVQLRGANYSGFEFVAIQGWSPSDPSGAQAGQAGGPNYAAMVSNWHANVVRIPLNEASWLGYTCVDSSGVSHNPDPGGNYQSAVITQVTQATQAGLYVILDLHWAAPGNTCPMLQTQMADADHSIDFWTSVASTFKSNLAVLFELYNEPYLYGLTGSETDWQVLMQGGTLSYYPSTSGSGNYQNVNTTWQVAGMQQMIDAVRAAGAHNVVLVGGTGYCNDLSGWLAHMPIDSLGQMAAAWHPYPPEQFVSAAKVAGGGSGYAVGDTITLAQPNTVYDPAVLTVTSVSGGAVSGVSIQGGGAYLQTNLPSGAVGQGSTSGHGSGASFSLGFTNLASTWSMPTNWPAVQAISQQLPVIITETGEHNAPGTAGAPFLQQFLPFADANGWSVVGWAWDVWGNYDDVLITDANGTPTPGYGQVFHDWMNGSAWQ